MSETPKAVVINDIPLRADKLGDGEFALLPPDGKSLITIGKNTYLISTELFDQIKENPHFTDEQAKAMLGN